MSDYPARHLNLAGASNFRDLGGYPARDGRPVRWRQIFRSNHLGHLTEADIELLRPLGLKSAFDFRGTEERAAAMCGIEEISVDLPFQPSRPPHRGRYRVAATPGSEERVRFSRHRGARGGDVRH